MGRFYNRFDHGSNPMTGVGLLRLLIDDLEQAGQLAAGREDVLARLDDLRKLIVYCYLGEQVGIADGKQQEKERTLEWFTWSYRMRNSHMTSWLTFRSTVGRPAAEELGEPTWFWRNTIKDPSQNPWRVDEPITRSELDAKLAAIKQDVGTVAAMPEIQPVRNLVVVRMDNWPASQRTRKLIYSAGCDLALASLDGSPIPLHISVPKWGVNRPEAEYLLSTLDGEPVLEGKLPEGEDYDLQLKVPAAGVYHFSCYMRGRGVDLHFPPSLPAGLIQNPGKTYRQSGLVVPVFFYVPRGTKEVKFYADNCGTIRITAPDNQVLHEAPSDGIPVTIPVPPGMDGQPWTLGGVSNMRLRRFILLNVPNVISLHANMILVPRPIAEADGLTIVGK
jgi:hypothetical protein